MALKLRPARPRRRNFLRLSIPVIALPMLGLLVLIQAASLRSPLSESEAPLAIAVRYPKRGLSDAAPVQTSAAATAVASVGPSVLGTSEFRLRSLGVVVGCAALGLIVWLGERLFSTRAGVLAAVILIGTDAGRSLLGTEFGIEPFYLLAILMALGAIRNLSVDKASLIRAGIAGGTAIAFVGPSASWIPVMAVAWLRRLRGLNLRSFSIAVGTTLLAAVAVAALSALALGVAPLPVPTTLPPMRDSAIGFGLDTIQMIPILPLVLLGLWNIPKYWRRQGSPNFLWIWLVVASLAMLVFGAFAPLWVALAMTLAVVASWAIARAPRAHITAAVATCVALGIWLGSFESATGRFDVDRWAVREAGKFVRRNLDAGSVVAAPDTARSRLSYYATRSIAPLDSTSAELEGLDYVVLDRRVVAPSSTTPGERPPRELELRGRRLQVVAEFGSWMLARVEPA